MQVDDVTEDRLRRLSGLTVGDDLVLSLFLDLDPAEFGTQPARASAIRSVLDEAGRAIADREDLTHDQTVALREDLDRAEAFFEDDFSAEGAHGLALFACGPADLFEALRLPRPPRSGVTIDNSPFIEPLAELGVSRRWAVMLASRDRGRILRGSSDRLVEIVNFSDDVHGQHQQGGWSQARYERSVDREAAQHVAAVCDELLRAFRRVPFDHLLVASTEEVWRDVESHLDPELQRRLAGRFDCEIGDASPDDILAAARPAMLEADREHRRALIDRLDAGVSRGGPADTTAGGAVTGLAAVLDGLVQRRVEALLVDQGFSAPGVRCPQCGWMALQGERCPLDDTELEHHENIVETAVASAVLQSAELVSFGPDDHPAPAGEPARGTPIGERGGIGAILRF